MPTFARHNPTPFTLGELSARHAAVRARMQAQGIDILLVASPANMNYLTGYDAWSFYVPQLVCISLDRDEVYWLGRGIDVPCAQMTSILPDSCILGYEDHYVQSPDSHPMERMAEQLEALGLDRGTIAVESDEAYYTVRSDAALRAGLPNAVFVHDHQLVNWVRLVKSEDEITLMRRTARIMERVMETALAAIEPGVRQCDVAARILATQAQGTQTVGGDYPAIMPLMMTGRGSAAPHLTWSDEPFLPNTGTCLELAAAVRRYHCPLSRTLHLGPPPTAMVEAAKLLQEGIEAALDAGRAGNRMCDIWSAWSAVLTAGGHAKSARSGYSIGIGYPPDWGEGTVSVRAEDTTVLQENMTLHFMPALWLDGWGIEISESIRITNTGAEALCRVPRALLVKD